MQTGRAVVAVFISFLIVVGSSTDVYFESSERPGDFPVTLSESGRLHCRLRSSTWFGVLVGNYIKDLHSNTSTGLDLTHPKYSNFLTFCQGSVNGKAKRSKATEIILPSKERVRIRLLPCLSKGPIWMLYCGLWESVSLLRKNVYSYDEPFRMEWDHECRTNGCRSKSHPFGPFMFLRGENEAWNVSCTYQTSFATPARRRSLKVVFKTERSRATPVLLVPKSNVTRFKQSDTLLLTCVDDSEIVWLLNGKVVTSSSRIKVTRFNLGQHLLVRNVASSDSGVFTCQRTGSPGSHVNISVDLEVEVFVPSTGVDVKCCVKERRAFPLRFRWLFNGNPMSHGRVHQVDQCSVLHLGPLKWNESGRYWCQVNVIPGPRFKIIPEDWLFWPWTTSYSYRNVTSFKVFRTERNRFAPRITLSQSSKDGRIEVDLASSNGVIATVLVRDGDEDKEGPGRVAACSVECDLPECPVFSVLQRRPDGVIVGRIVAASPHATVGNLRLRILCRDSGEPPKTTTKEVVVSACSQCGQDNRKTTARLVRLLNTSEPDDAVDKLQNITTRPEALTSLQVQLSVMATSSALNSLSRVNETEKISLLKGATNVISNCLRSSEKAMEDSGKQIVETVSQLTATIPLSENRSRVVLSEEDLAVGASNVDRHAPGFVSFVVPPDGDDERAVISHDENLPASVAVSVRQSHVTGGRVDFSFFPSARIFHTNDAGVSVVSPVIAARANLQASTTAPGSDGQPPISDADQPVQLVFNSSKQHSSPLCAFWNATSANWADDGCSRRIEGRVVRCSCSHLTNFALIIRMDSTTLSQSHQKALSYLSWILLIVSIIALALTCYIYFSYVRQKQRNRRSGQQNVEASIQSSRTHICFSATLMLFLVFFLSTGVFKASGTSCAAVGALNHFLLLSVFSWSVIEGVQICSSIIHVAMQSGMVTQNVRMFTIVSMTLGWGIPVVVVGLTLLITKTNAYGILGQPESFCFFKDRLAMYVAFLLPVCLALLTNLIIISMLVYVLKCRMGLGNIQKKKQERSKRKVFGFLGVFVALNVTWLVGLLNIGDAKIVISYIFVILNGLQGFFVFICYCIFQMEVRKHMKKHLVCFKWMPEFDERSTTTSGSDARFLTETSNSVVYSSHKESISLTRRRML